VGDKVFGFTWSEQAHRPHQEYATVPAYLLGKIPHGTSMQEAVTLPDNVGTIFHSLTEDLAFELPWPLPSAIDGRRKTAVPSLESPILVWGAASSCGQYALQILRYYGYVNVFATASAKHHDYLKTMGAKECFDYRDANVVQEILAATKGTGLPYFFDTIGSLEGSIRPISKIAEKGAKVAVLMPVVLKDASESEAPEYSFDAPGAVPWADGVEVRGVRTHQYLKVRQRRSLRSMSIPLLHACSICPSEYAEDDLC